MSATSAFVCQQNGVSKSSSERVEDQDEKVLLAPFVYMCEIPGKQVRTRLAQAFNFWLKIRDDKLAKIVEIIDMLHNASLMIDDIEDSSILRRGSPVVHSIYGVARTINSANYVYFLALAKTLDLGDPLATAVYTEQMLELHRGQGMELHWRDTVTCPSEDEYLKMVSRKTGGLFDLAVRLMQLFSDAPVHVDYTALTNTLGVYFQIRDDYANLCSKEYAEKKSFCEDLTEGKFSFPIIHAIRSGDERGSQVLQILRQKPTCVEVKKYCVELLEKAGSFEYTRRKLVELETRAVKLIGEYGGNAFVMSLIEQLRVIYTPSRS